MPNTAMLSTSSAAATTASNHDLSLYCPHIPSERQAEFLSLGMRLAMYGGRANCGKSDVALMAALQGIASPDYSAILLRRTYKDLMLPGALLDRAHKWWDKSPAKWEANNMWFRFPSGAKIAFGYLDSDADLDRYQSAEFHFIGIDEATQFTEKQLRHMFARLRRTLDFQQSIPLRVRLFTNPGGPSHKFLCKLFGISEVDRFPHGCKPKVARDEFGEAQVFFPATAEDNPGTDWKEYERTLSMLPPTRLKQLRDGVWIQDTSGLCYPSIQVVRTMPHLPDGHTWSHGLGLDIGATNNTALVHWAWCDDLPESYMVSAKKPENINTPTDVADAVRIANEAWNFEFMTADHGALGKGYVNEMRKWHGLPIVNAEKNDKRGYIELFDGAMANGMIVLLDGQCDPFVEEASELLWKDEKDERKPGKIEETPGQANHCCDAGLYGWRKVQHYSHTPRKEEPADEGQALELRILASREAEQRTARKYGMTFPKGYR